MAATAGPKLLILMKLSPTHQNVMKLFFKRIIEFILFCETDMLYYTRKTYLYACMNGGRLFLPGQRKISWAASRFNADRASGFTRRPGPRIASSLSRGGRCIIDRSPPPVSAPGIGSDDDESAADSHAPPAEQTKTSPSPFSSDACHVPGHARLLHYLFLFFLAS